MTHPAHLPIKEILAAIPRGELLGLWVQNPADGTGPKHAPVRVAIQYGSAGNAAAAAGDGASVAEASAALLAELRGEETP